jgi:hypothetical protein
VTGPEGEQINLEATPPFGKAQGAEEGYAADFTPAREGSYRVEAEAQLAGKLLGRDRKNFVVAFPFGEAEDGRPRPELLKQIAASSHGEFLPLSEWSETSLERMAAKLESAAPSQIVERTELPLWSTLTAFSVILLLLGSEWWLRRKWGLI